MTKIHLPYVHIFKDRHGKTRRYYRRSGRRVPLPGYPGSEEFMDAYQAAAADMPTPVIGASRTIPRSINHLVVKYYQSPKFTTLARLTKANYRGIIEPIREQHGDKPVRLLKAIHIQAIIDAKADTPAAANHLLDLFKILMKLSVKLEWRADNPTVALDRVPYESDGYHTWTEEEIAQYEAHFPAGTMARLALDLFLHTGQRVSDVARMGRQHIKDGILTIRQDKSRGSKKAGNLVEIPIHGLLETLDALPRTNMTFMTTAYGRPFTARGFGNRVKKWCKEAGLPQCSAHGLRKSAAKRLAEAGCTPHQIMAITGHETLSEVERYTKAVDKKKNAEAAVEKLRRAK